MIELSFELDDAAGPYAAGGELCGRLDLRNIDDRVRDAEIFLEWRTSDEDSQRARCASQRLAVAALALGGRARPPFKLKLPDAPVSYAGSLFSVAWYLIARVDVSWARDPQIERRIEVVGRAPSIRPTKRPLAIALGRPRPARRGLTRPPLKKDAYSIANVIAPGIAGAMLASGIGSPLVGAAVAVGGSAFLLGYRRWTRTAAVRAFGAPSLSMNGDEPQVGQPLHVRVAISPPQALKGVRVQYMLVAREAMWVSSGRSGSVHTHEVHASQGLIGSREDVAAAHFFDAVVPIPEVHASSFDAQGHAVFWLLEIDLTATLGSGSAVTLRDEVELTVRP